MSTLLLVAAAVVLLIFSFFSVRFRLTQEILMCNEKKLMGQSNTYTKTELTITPYY
uniref:Uncharacterized protein n=1 Tax=Anguilla anguilla TaxID=7936 RepID=A0A0E9T848_ANGAN